MLIPAQTVHPIRDELSKSSDMATAVRISLILCSVIYATVGFFGYLLFGDSTMADILSNFDRSSASAQFSPLLNNIVRLSYALHLVLVFPLLNFSLRINLDGLLFPKHPTLASDAGRFLPISGFLFAAAYIAAIAIPDIWTVFPKQQLLCASLSSFLGPLFWDMLIPPLRIRPVFTHMLCFLFQFFHAYFLI